MFTKPEQLTPVAVARPMRVAYLIDLDDAPDALFDEINLEAYGRWGGRRTLIAPAKPAGIDPRYLDWATYFNADIIYGFVKLDDAVVADLHELLGPAFLRFHEDRRRNRGGGAQLLDPAAHGGRLQLVGVSGLRKPILDARASASEHQVLTKFWDRGESFFLEENFGLMLASFMGGAIASGHPDLFRAHPLRFQVGQKPL